MELELRLLDSLEIPFGKYGPDDLAVFNITMEAHIGAKNAEGVEIFISTYALQDGLRNTKRRHRRNLRFRIS